MKILVLNCGSSSLKYQLFNMENEEVLAKGLVEKIGLEGAELTHNAKGKKTVISAEIPNHTVAIKLVIDALTSPEHGVIGSLSEIEAVGHRSVHGGMKFASSVLINDEVIKVMDDLCGLAPLHNPPVLLGVRACLENIPGVPMVGVFDTAFHQTMPPSSYIYALGYELFEKYDLRRYGFHGTSHRFVSQEVLPHLDKPAEETKIITCHLGNGSSITAVKGGKSFDTTMGFTPQEGVVMGTRSGDIDPAIVPFIMKNEGLSPADADNYINKKSGILGISGVSSDLRYVEQAAKEGNKRAQLAIDVLTKSIIKYIGAYAAEMNGVDAIVFTAGIGENAIDLRANICQNLTYLGVDFDAEANNIRGQFKEITKTGSAVKVFVVPTNEELMIARDTRDIVSKLK